MKTYDVFYDGTPEEITAIGYLLMQKWIAFALGAITVNSFKVAHPTGRMASAVRLEGKGTNHVAVIVDETIAPEAGYLEEGHAAIDMKDYLHPGQFVPLHYGSIEHTASTGQKFSTPGYGAPILNQTMGGRAKNVWATPRNAGFSGGARLPGEDSTKTDSWIIPSMPAWSVVGFLAESIRNGTMTTSTT